MDPDNNDRAEWAQMALETFAEVTGMDDEDTETIAGDLLCDIMHLCRNEGVSFETILERARGHFEEEVYEEEHPDGD